MVYEKQSRRGEIRYDPDEDVIEPEDWDDFPRYKRNKKKDIDGL